MKMEPEEFLKKYEQATNTHDFKNVRPLLAKEIIYWFSDGKYTSISQLEEAFNATWKRIKKEKYSISDVKWISITATNAICTYTFKWEGIVRGTLKQGHGKGTNVIIKESEKWVMKHEHLSVDK